LISLADKENKATSEPEIIADKMSNTKIKTPRTTNELALRWVVSSVLSRI
jgi:hypothetical protein